MLSFLKRLFRTGKAPEVGLQANPVSLNPSPGARAIRNAARIARLEEAMKSATGKYRASLAAELKRRRGG